MTRPKEAFHLTSSSAFRFVLMMGVVNLFADVTYEGASSINGPFLGSLGASAAIIGVVAGVGEFLGYSLRSVAGYIGDWSRCYWLLTFAGYGINLLAVPALALAGNWPVAAGLMIAERVGRAIRKPTVEAMLSYTTGTLGKGWVYGLNTGLDETGATIGPLLMALVLFLKGSYQTAYALLLISAVLALVSLTTARVFFPHPSRLERQPVAKLKGFSSAYWLYMVAGACFAAGLISFELISYHLSKTGIVSRQWVPLFLAISTGLGVVANLVLGKLFDRWGLPVVLVAVLLSSIFAPLVFWGNFTVALIGIILWGIGFATQDTLLKAIIAGLLPHGKRNSAFGLFYAGYGVGWLVGNVTTGLLYDRALYLLIAFSVVAQWMSMPFFILAKRQERLST